MTPVNFDPDDRKLLFAEIRRLLLTFLYVFIIAAILAFVLVHWIQNAELDVNPILIYSIFGLGCLAVLFFKLMPAVFELRRGIKYVVVGRIMDKKKKPRYAYSENIVVDSTIKLGLVEYYVVIDDKEIWVEEEFFNTLNISEEVSIHYSVRNGRIMKMTKKIDA